MSAHLHTCNHHWTRVERDDGSAALTCTLCGAEQSYRDSTDPYLASPKATEGLWYDSFVKSGRFCWLVFNGSKLLAEVQNEQQARNITDAIRMKCECGAPGAHPRVR
jgi:hypothetical protein